MASDTAAGLAAIARGAPFGAVQAALPAPDEPDALLPAARAAGFGLLTHSVFGIDGAFAALKARAAADPAFRARVLDGAGEGALDAALGRAACSPAPSRSTPTASSSSRCSRRRSLAANLAAADRPIDPAAIAL